MVAARAVVVVTVLTKVWKVVAVVVVRAVVVLKVFTKAWNVVAVVVVRAMVVVKLFTKVWSVVARKTQLAKDPTREGLKRNQLCPKRVKLVLTCSQNEHCF